MYYAKLMNPNYGLDSDKENVKVLNSETVYEVNDVDIGGWISYVSLIGLEGQFNTVQFDFFDEDMKEIDIIESEIDRSNYECKKF